MKTTVYALALLFCTSILAQERAIIDANDQVLTWIGKAAVGGYAPEGTLKISSAEVTYSPTQIKQLRIEVAMKSLTQENKQLAGHLKDKDFFHVKKFPVATFVLSSPVDITNGKASLKGTMTIKEKQREEVFVAEVEISEQMVQISIDQKLDRTRYGINFNSPSIFKKMKENLIADEFILKGSLVFKTE